MLSQDILAVPDDALMKTEVLATIVDGRVLYEKPLTAPTHATESLEQAHRAARETVSETRTRAAGSSRASGGRGARRGSPPDAG